MSLDPREEMEELQRKADRISSLILNSEYPLVEIAMERHRLREEFLRRYPDRIWLYDLIYESRFERLIAQWREEAD